MRGIRRSVAFLLLFTVVTMMAAGCGSNMATSKNSKKTDVSGATSETGTMTEETKGADNSNMKDTDKKDADTDNKNAGTDHKMGVAGEAAEDAAEGAGNAMEDVARGTGDMIEGAGEAVDDVADGMGDALDNLGGGSFESYEDAKAYFMDKLRKDNAAAHYELRNEKKDLVSYNNNDSGARGYEFTVYETDGNERIGRYYVDKETGKIYRYMGKNSIEAY